MNTSDVAGVLWCVALAGILAVAISDWMGWK